MPPRIRRSGSRRGALSPEIKEAMRREAERLSNPDDPLGTIRAVNDAYAAMDHELERFATVRRRAIRAMRRQGWSYEQIGDATGISRSRLWQLDRGYQRSGKEA